MMYMYKRQRYLKQVSRHDFCVTTCTILLLLFVLRISYESLSDYMVLIFKLYTVPLGLQDVTNVFNNHETLFVSIFTARIWRHFSIKSQLR